MKCPKCGNSDPDRFMGVVGPEKDLKSRCWNCGTDVLHVDTSNDFLVSSNMLQTVILMPPRGRMTRDEALRLAAWLVMIADDGETERLMQILNAIKGT